MKTIAIFLAAMLLGFSAAAALGETPAISAEASEIDKYGHVRLALSPEQLEEAGFALGDVVTVTVHGYTADMPYLNGYYVDAGEMLLLAYPGRDYVTVCINYGRFADAAGVSVGDRVAIAMREKAGALALQEISELVYTDDIADYGGDEAVFANFRAIEMGGIGPGKLYRSASPVLNGHGRAVHADRLIQEAGVRTVMNMADSAEEIALAIGGPGFASQYYASLFAEGNVTALSLPIDFNSDAFGEGVARGLTFLAHGEAPFLVHCREGKDRAGFASMVIEMLAGAPAEDITRDYMLSYVNYYGLEEGSEKYGSIREKNILEMMRSVCGLEKDAPLEGADLALGARTYLMEHGMEEEDIDLLLEKLK